MKDWQQFSDINNLIVRCTIYDDVDGFASSGCRCPLPVTLLGFSFMFRYL